MRQQAGSVGPCRLRAAPFAFALTLPGRHRHPVSCPPPPPRSLSPQLIVQSSTIVIYPEELGACAPL